MTTIYFQFYVNVFIYIHRPNSCKSWDGGKGVLTPNFEIPHFTPLPQILNSNSAHFSLIKVGGVSKYSLIIKTKYVWEGGMVGL